jgi:VIT1/CCC1 family predicted Fe2+/Mn2+ transporter
VDPAEQPAAIRWLQAHAVGARWVGGALGVLALLFLVDGWWGLFWTVLVVGLFEAAVSYLASRRPAVA